MPEHDRINILLASLFGVPVLSYSTDFKLVSELLTEVEMIKIGNYWYCKLDGVEWDGTSEPTKALAVCAAIFRKFSLPWCELG